MACDGLLTGDILFNCDFASIAGLEVNILLVNSADIDRSAITYDPANKVLMTNFQLLSGKTGFLLQGIKQVNSTAWELVKKENGLDKKKHIFNGFILTLSAANKLQLEEMTGSYVVVVEKKYKGENSAEAFDVYGIDSGLELNVTTYNSAENDGAALIELSSVDGFEEPKQPVTLLMTDYATTKTLKDNKFVQV